MSAPLNEIYTFDRFQFDAHRLAFYFGDQLIMEVGEKTLLVLAVLLANANRLTPHDEIIEYVWGTNLHGINSVHVAQYIRKLRKILAELAPDKEYIETVKGRGYMFVGEVVLNKRGKEDALIKPEAAENTETEPLVISSELAPETVIVGESNASDNTDSHVALSKRTLVFAAAAICLLIFFSWMRFSDNNGEEKIKQTVKESQLFESLILYKNPSSFEEQLLDKFWTKELDVNSNYDRQRIREAVRKLNSEGRKYGDETKCEQFEFQSVEINESEDFAVVKTLEKWFIAVYSRDGILEKNKTVGPYFVSYILRQIDGEWLIEKSTTARMIRPTPRLTDVKIISEAKPKEQFYVTIRGQDFEPETVYIKVIGEGCPENSPCKVPNSALREHAKLSAIALENVPLTLASGDFQITLHNDNSPPSNALSINIP